MYITTMELDELRARLASLAGKKVSEVKVGGSMLVLEIARAESKAFQSIIMSPTWSVLIGKELEIGDSRFDHYQENFATKQEWLDHKKLADEDRKHLEKLRGIQLHKVTLSDDGASLALDLDNNVRIASTFCDRGFDTRNFMYTDPSENLTCSLSKGGLEVIFSELGQIVASREFTFRKSGKDFTATVSFGAPRLVCGRESTDHSYYSCGFQIECELGGARGESGGADSLQALQHALVLAQHRIDKLAKKFEAEVFHLEEDMDPIYKFRENFSTLHSLMGKLYEETHFDKQFAATKDGIECLKQMDKVLTLLKEFREDERP
jgi:hypothetical protein